MFFCRYRKHHEVSLLISTPERPGSSLFTRGPRDIHFIFLAIQKSEFPACLARQLPSGFYLFNMIGRRVYFCLVESWTEMGLESVISL